MLPLIPFVLGIATGVVAVRLFKTKTSQEALDKVQDQLREATRSGLEGVSKVSDKIRAHLEPDPVIDAGEPMEKDLAVPASVQPALIPPTAEPKTKE